MDTRAAIWCVPERRYISEFKACNRYVAPSQGKVSAADPPSQRSRGLFRIAGRNRIEDPSAFWGTFPSISNSVPNANDSCSLHTQNFSKKGYIHLHIRCIFMSHTHTYFFYSAWEG